MKQATSICYARDLQKWVNALPSRHEGVADSKLYTSWPVSGTDVVIAIALGRNRFGHIAAREVITVVPWQVDPAVTAQPKSAAAIADEPAKTGAAKIKEIEATLRKAKSDA